VEVKFRDEIKALFVGAVVVEVRAKGVVRIEGLVNIEAVVEVAVEN